MSIKLSYDGLDKGGLWGDMSPSHWHHWDGCFADSAVPSVSDSFSITLHFHRRLHTRRVPRRPPPPPAHPHWDDDDDDDTHTLVTLSRQGAHSITCRLDASSGTVSLYYVVWVYKCGPLIHFSSEPAFVPDKDSRPSIFAYCCCCGWW